MSRTVCAGWDSSLGSLLAVLERWVRLYKNSVMGISLPRFAGSKQITWMDGWITDLNVAAGKKSRQWQSNGKRGDESGEIST